MGHRGDRTAFELLLFAQRGHILEDDRRAGDLPPAGLHYDGYDHGAEKVFAVVPEDLDAGICGGVFHDAALILGLSHHGRQPFVAEILQAGARLEAEEYLCGFGGDFDAVFEVQHGDGGRQRFEHLADRLAGSHEIAAIAAPGVPQALGHGVERFREMTDLVP